MKAYETRITAAEAARILLTFSARAFVWAQENSIMAETLSDRKMVLVSMTISDDYSLIVDDNLFQSECFWSQAFCGMDKCRFIEAVVEDWDEVFDTADAELIGDTSPMSLNEESYMEPDYDDMCRRMGVNKVDLDAEKDEELKELQPLVADGTLSDYDAECVAFSLVNRIDRGDLKGWDLRAARIAAVVERKKWDILNEYEWKIGEKFPEPPVTPLPHRPRKPSEKAIRKAPSRRK